jgi:Protein of unknown function (DUF2490)
MKERAACHAKPRRGPDAATVVHATATRVFVCAGLAATLAASDLVHAAAPPDPDAQVWSETDLIGAVGKNTTLTGIAIARFGEDVANPTLTALGLQADHKIGKWTLAASYRHQVVRHESGGPTISQLAIAMATYTDTFGRSTIAIRTRADNTLHSTGNPWRFRIRGEYRWSTPRAGPISYVFVNDEAFYQGSASEWTRNRAQAGMNFKFDRRYDLSVYYQWQNDEMSKPARINALGLLLKIDFE